MAATTGGGNTDNDRIQKETQVTAVADDRLQAVIVSAPNDLMEQIAGMMNDLDVPSPRDQNVYVFQTKNSDPQQVAQVLQSMFGNGSASSSSTTTSPLQQRQQNGATEMTTTTTTSGIGGTSVTGGARGGGGF